jgi:hypothetical protein
VLETFASRLAPTVGATPNVGEQHYGLTRYCLQTFAL